jgi:hypothetical protein
MSYDCHRLCSVCGFQMLIMSRHCQFSPRCDPSSPGRDRRETPDDLSSFRDDNFLGDNSTASLADRSEAAPSLSSNRESSLSVQATVGGCTHDDLDDDDCTLVFNTESHITATCPDQSVRPHSATPPELPATSSDVTTTRSSSLTIAAAASFSVVNTQLDAGCRVVPPPAILEPVIAEHFGMSNASLESGHVYTAPPNFRKGQHCFTKKDCSMMRLHTICDQAGAPRHLMDRVLAQMKVEISRNEFDPLLSSLTKRDPFMGRMHRKFPSPPPEAILVDLECFAEPITVCRFNALAQLQQHLLRKDLYGDLSKLNVNQRHPFNQSLPVPSSGMREITDGTWHPNAVARSFSPLLPAPDDLAELFPESEPLGDQFRKFVLTL